MSLLWPMKAKADNYGEAIKKASQAFYLQSGLDDRMDRYARHLERRFLPEIVLENGGVLFFIAESVVNEEIRIRVKWTF